MVLADSEDEIKVILRELFEQTDRGAAIIAVAIIEELLTDILKERLILNYRLKDMLFSYEKNGALAHFSQKIDIAFAVGILGPKNRNNLHNFRRIRNRFSHQIEPLTFDCETISPICFKLDDFGEKSESPRFHFLSASTLEMMYLFSLKLTIPKITPLRDDKVFVVRFDDLWSRTFPDDHN